MIGRFQGCRVGRVLVISLVSGTSDDVYSSPKIWTPRSGRILGLETCYDVPTPSLEVRVLVFPYKKRFWLKSLLSITS